MSRRVVCSHGSSLSTAVQYAGQGKVTLHCVRARARSRSPPQFSRCPILSHVSAHVYVTIQYTVALSLRIKVRTEGQGRQVEKDERRAEEKAEDQAAEGKLQPWTIFVGLAVEPVAYRAHRFHRGLSHVVRSVAINFRNAAGSAPTEGSAGSRERVVHRSHRLFATMTQCRADRFLSILTNNYNLRGSVT
ncbi:hypothetical protein ALC56_01572 [Trachymyrmex septentrionalis]|uniref:Uncharacterized protein n=1 Tax=Trachymyrmex septentrionalis TaxID=34720 RepID=A0A195FW17_9HYME|nr:hypothetical protein ALC56_01572 [Trachymyrmex septentrionalis]